MSILIGGQNPLSGNNLTNKERINLVSTTQSNLVLLQTTLPSTNIEFDSSFIFGRSNNSFYFNQSGIDNLIVGCAGIIAYPATYIKNSLSVSKNALFSSNVTINSNLSVPNIYSSNIQIRIPYNKNDSTINNNPPVYYGSYDNSGNSLVTMTSDGSVNITNNVTMNNSTVALDTYTGSLSTGYIYNPTWKTNNLIDPKKNVRIELTNALISLLGNTQIGSPNNTTGINQNNLEIFGNLAVHGTFNLTTVIAKYIECTSNMLSSQLHLSNYNFPNDITLKIEHNSLFTNTDIINVSINNSNSQNFSALRMDSAGLIYVGPPPGTDNFKDRNNNIISNKNIITNAIQSGIFNLYNYNNIYGTSNVLNIVTTSNLLAIDNSLNIGIGTNIPKNKLHISKDYKFNPFDSNAFIGLYNYNYNYANNSNPSPFIVASSNNIPLFHVNNNGSLTIGNIPPNSNFNINLASNMNVPVILVNQINGGNIDANGSNYILLNNTQLSNVGSIYGSSINMNSLSTLSTLITDFFSAQNFHINGLDISSTNGFFNVYQPISWFSSSNICLSFNSADLQTPATMTSDGRLKIITETPSDSTTSVGLLVKGVWDNCIRVNSQGNPSYQLYKQDNAGSGGNPIYTKSVVGIDSADTFYINHQPSSLGATIAGPRMQINAYGVFFENKIQIDPSGKLGINTFQTISNPPPLTYNLQVNGTALFRSTLTASPILFLNDSTQFVGIGTTSPVHTLHVQGDSFTSGISYINNLQTTDGGVLQINGGSLLNVNSIAIFNSNVEMLGLVGINTSSPNPSYSLDIVGDLNVSGRIFQGDRENIPNPYGSTTNGVNITSNVGIGLLHPNSQFEVYGNTILTGPSFNIPGHALYQRIPMTSYTSFVNVNTQYNPNVLNSYNYTVLSSSMSNILNAFDGATGNSSKWTSAAGYSTNNDPNITGKWVGNTSNSVYNPLYTPQYPADNNIKYAGQTLVDGNIVYGHWIQVSTYTPVYYSSVYISPVVIPNPFNDPNLNIQNSSSPYSLQIVGSHDGINWTLLAIPIENIDTGNGVQGISWTFYQSTTPNQNIYTNFPIPANKGAFEYIRVIFTRIYGGDNVTNYVEISDIVFNVTPNSVYINNGTIAVGASSNARQAIDVMNGNVIVNGGNIGVGTLNPVQPLHVIGESLLLGNVGISNAMPKYALDVVGDVNFTGKMYNNSSIFITSQWISSNQSAAMLNTDIYTMSNVGIGTNSPQSNLHVQGNTYFGGNVTCQNNLSILGTLFTRGNIASTSDKTLKTDLVIIGDPIDKISKLTGYTYRRLDTNLIETGLIAQNVLEIMPELVNKDTQDLLTISYGNMAGLFVEAIKALNEKIEKLETDVATLRSQLA